jgi:hypothetical protein
MDITPRGDQSLMTVARREWEMEALTPTMRSEASGSWGPSRSLS